MGIPFPFLVVLFLLLGSSLAHSTAAPSLIEAVGSRSVDVGAGDDSDKCVYTVYARTGSVWKAGTDSVIGVELTGSDGSGVQIADLGKWGGLMGEGHNYFERGNLDVFSGLGRCTTSPPCRLNLTSDGSGANHGWYCNYVEVTTTGPHAACAQQLFTVEQWLATDSKPYQLYALRDNCAATAAGKDEDH
ncbi:PLAT domain-containing protein 3-like isoform X1 [Ananas comosus]|uniref:PLAT domain-containing protein 3-like isoform X1 n=1 Tax=Ananas comosus TaxID=4615 RepID=A0A6P5F4Q6_ANACO|nr:PLAT domain-containing protein 3-like isoform X1 [Ananas comosus]